MYISVRRLFLTAGRWIQHNMVDTVFAPNDPQLWARIGRELNAYFKRLFERGALKGGTPQEAFYIKCDADTNPLEVRNLGQVVTEIGLAPSLPNEFIVVRIITVPAVSQSLGRICREFRQAIVLHSVRSNNYGYRKPHRSISRL